MNVCRLCLHKGDENEVASIWKDQINNLETKIYNCVSIHINKDDNLPTTVCLSCIHKVTQWVIFKETCDNSTQILLNELGEKYSLNYIIESQHEGLKPSNSDNKSDLFSHYCDNKNVGSNNNVGANRKILPASKRKLLRKRYQSSESEHSISDVEDKDDFFSDIFDNPDYKVNLQSNTYICEICSVVFDNCLEYLDHQEVHDGNTVFQCDKCPEMYKCRKDLVEHDKNHRGPCPQCGKMILKSSMKLHLIKHTDRHKCLQCPGRFNSKAALAQHIITVHTDIKDHICETCGKRFSTKTAMRVHMKSHSDERLYPCKLCSYAGRTASAIYVHMSTHANELRVCEICSKTFKSNRNLNDHLRRVHSKEKKHKCSYCDKKFVDKYMLRVHIRCHTGVRPYQCKLCEKAFIRSDGLKEHMATHGQRVMYDCRNCGKKFTSKRGVTRHNCTSVL